MLKKRSNLCMVYCFLLIVFKVTDRMLEILVTSHEYVAVFFQGSQCNPEEEGDLQQDDEEAIADGDMQEDGEEGEVEVAKEEEETSVDCDQVLAELEGIDDELDEIGILIVTTKETRVAAENGKKGETGSCDGYSPGAALGKTKAPGKVAL